MKPGANSACLIEGKQKGTAVASKLVRIAKADLEANPGAEWNGFVDLLAVNDYEDLAPRQRAAHLVFWYESEVQNGGHLQFFSNPSGERADETVSALAGIGAPAHAEVLRRALARWRARPRLPRAEADDYAAVALEGEFDELDRAFHNCGITLVEVLQRHLAEHWSDFILRE